MNSTEELRAMLDERGVKYYRHEDGEPLRELKEGADRATSWRIGKASCTAFECTDGTIDLWIDRASPSDIEATLGRGECHDTGCLCFTCSACGWISDEPRHFFGGFEPNYCPNCGAKVVGE